MSIIKGSGLLKKMFCGILAATMLFAAGCSQNTPQASDSQIQTKGRYQESSVPMPGDRNGVAVGMWVHTNGTMDYLVKDSLDNSAAFRHYRSNDGQDWTEESADWSKQLSGKEEFFTTSEDGTLFYIENKSTDPKGLSGPYEFWKAPLNGTPQMMNLTSLSTYDQKNAQVNIRAFEAFPQNRLLVSGVFISGPNTGNNFAILYNSQDGTKIADLDNFFSDTYSANQNTLFSVTRDGEVSAVALSDGHKSDQYSASLSSNEPIMQFTVDKDGNIYYLTKTGLNKLITGGSIAETIMNSSEFSFGSPAYVCTYLGLNVNGDFYMTLNSPDAQNGTLGALFRYHYNQDIPSVPDKTLTVFSLNDSTIVRAAVTTFQQKNPDVLVNFEAAFSNGSSDPTAVQDALSQLNTKLLAGNGPDVLILDGMPWESYANKGFLEDLNGKVSTDGVFQAAAKAFVRDGKTFAVPVQCSLPVLFGKTSELDKINSLDDLVAEAKTPGQTLLAADNLRELFNILYAASSPALMDTKTGVNTEALSKFLTSLKGIADIDGVSSKDAPAPTIDPDNIEYLKAGLTSFTGGTARLGYIQLEDVGMISFSLGSGEENGMKILPGLSQNAFLPKTEAAIVSNSKQKDLAAGFINTMLSPALQEYNTHDGLPVLMEAADKQIQANNDMNVKNGFQALDINMSQVLGGLSTAVVQDPIVTEKVYDSAKQYCAGGLTLDAAISKIQQDLNQYLQEKQ